MPSSDLFSGSIPLLEKAMNLRSTRHNVLSAKRRDLIIGTDGWIRGGDHVDVGGITVGGIGRLPSCPSFSTPSWKARRSNGTASSTCIPPGSPPSWWS